MTSQQSSLTEELVKEMTKIQFATKDEKDPNSTAFEYDVRTGKYKINDKTLPPEWKKKIIEYSTNTKKYKHIDPSGAVVHSYQDGSHQAVNRQLMIETLECRGYSPAAIAGIVGRTQQESDFRDNAVNVDFIHLTFAYGLAQWRGPRLDKLIKKTISKDLVTIKEKAFRPGVNTEAVIQDELKGITAQNQIDFIIYELETERQYKDLNAHLKIT